MKSNIITSKPFLSQDIHQQYTILREICQYGFTQFYSKEKFTYYLECFLQNDNVCISSSCIRKKCTKKITAQSPAIYPSKQ